MIIDLPCPEDTERVGARLATLLAPGDLVILTGPLGAGKTAFVRGLASGLGVRGPITSPTFVIARRHPPLAGGPALVHVDAYRLEGQGDLEDLDLEAELVGAVVAVEWGEGVAEFLSDSALYVALDRGEGGHSLRVTAAGPRWEGIEVTAALARESGN